MNHAPRYQLEGVNYPSPDHIRLMLRSGAWLDSSLGDFCRSTGRDAPDKPFLVDDGEVLTFGELDARSERLADRLIRLGLKPGDTALFQMGTDIATVIALFGCFKAGVLPVCTLPQHRSLEILTIGRIVKPRVYFVQSDAVPNYDLVGFAQEMMKELDTLKHLILLRGPLPNVAQSIEVLWSATATADASLRTGNVRPTAADVAVLQLSGGSTGVPKIIPRFHGDFLGTGKAWADRLHITPDEVGLWALPLIHNAAMVLMLWPLMLMRAPLVILRKFDIGRFLAAIERHRVSYTGSIGPVAARLLECGDLAARDMSSLRVFITLQRAEAIERHVGVTTVTVYGITEGLLMASSPADSAQARFGTVGRPTMPLEVAKVLQPGTEIEVPDREVGELCFRGPTTLLSYFRAPEISATSFTASGLFRSGDLVRAHVIDGQRHFSFEGRLTDNINRGGEKFGAEELESVIARHPAVADVKVVPMPDADLGEKACAFIIPRSGMTLPNVTALGEFLLASGLAKYKLPERIEPVQAFPVTSVGKVDKGALKRAIAELVAAELAQPASQR